MNKLVAFIGGIVVGTVYSKQIKDAYKQYKDQVDSRRTSEITKLVEDRVNSYLKPANKMKPANKTAEKNDIASKIKKSNDGVFDPLEF